MYLIISLFRNAYKEQLLNEQQHNIAEKLKKDGWVDISFENRARLVVAKKPGKNWQLLSEDGRVIFTAPTTEKPEFHDGFWYCKTRQNDWWQCRFFDDKGVPVYAEDVREETKCFLYFEESKPEQRCCDCVNCEDTTHWLDVLTFQDSDYRFSCKEGLVSSLMNDQQAMNNKTASRCAKYKLR